MRSIYCVFNDTATTEIYTLSLHDALPIFLPASERREWLVTNGIGGYAAGTVAGMATRRYLGLLIAATQPPRSEEHTSELQSRQYLVCPLLLYNNIHFSPLSLSVPIACHLP